MASPPFRFKKFVLEQEGVVHPVGTDSVLLGAWANCSNAQNALDIGTGTGILALMLAQRSGGQLLVDAVEIDEASAERARRNVQQSPWASRIQVAHCPVQEFARSHAGKYDLIICNPPFFTETIVAPDHKRRLGRNTVALSFTDLIDTVKKCLRPEGHFCTILPTQEGKRFIELSALHGLYCNRETEVFGKAGKPPERLLLSLSLRAGSFWRESLCVYTEEKTYTAEFQTLTADFYLHF